MANNFFRKENALYFTWGRKKISNVFSSQVSGRAQLPGVFIYWVDHFGNYFISGGHTCTIWAHPNAHDDGDDDGYDDGDDDGDDDHLIMIKNN